MVGAGKLFVQEAIEFVGATENVPRSTVVPENSSTEGPTKALAPAKRRRKSTCSSQ